MLKFLFKKKEEKKEFLDASLFYVKLKELYKYDLISTERKEFLADFMKRYGYLPYSQIKALEELSPAEVLYALEFKWKKEGTLVEETFSSDNPSPLERRHINSTDWIKKEGHDIKLINLAALGNGNESDETGKFIDWLRQLLILPAGVEERGIFPTTLYLIPFHPREFGCAYLPTSSDVSKNLEDNEIKEKLNLDAKEQVKLFIQLAQLAGHPVIYDILPQTGRFAKVVLANPFIARWFDITELSQKIEISLEEICKKLEKDFDKEDVELVKDIYKTSGAGDLSEDYKKIYNALEKELSQVKKFLSEEMMKKTNQEKLQKRVKEIVLKINASEKKQILESDIIKQKEITAELIKQGLWTAPGGAWCSAGVPVFDKMSECKSYPVFNHYNLKGEDVSGFANLDCQTPFYFAFLENGQLNKPVVDFYVDYMQKLQSEYNFDGFRVDHVDHVVDDISVKNGCPVSYRIPKEVLIALNSKLKSKVPYFGTLAEYMLENNFLKEYHEEMKFDILWGNDISCQSEKTPEKIVEDNQNLAAYNTKNFNIPNLSILKTYNNQDGEFSCIDQYPGQLSESGALFKWFKYKFLPGGKNAQRPVMYVDGDESFTAKGIERTIDNEVALKRGQNNKFFQKFDAINRFAKSMELVTEGEAQIIGQNQDGFAAWIISKEPMKTALIVVANSNTPLDEFEEVFDKTVFIPGDYKIKSEFIFDGIDFIEKEYKEEENKLHFEELKPSEFKIYSIIK